jgi:16S rRNA (cytosine967-C5)-methyltransferase
MGVSKARAIVFDVLRRVEAEGAYASDLLHAELSPDVGQQDAGLATELVLGVLRWRLLLDFLLARYVKRPRGDEFSLANAESQIQRLDLPVVLALRMGLYQILFLERIPARAAVNESVELVKRARKSSAASLVNAVLRRLSVEYTSAAVGFSSGHTSQESTVKMRCAERLVSPNMPSADRLAILHSHPRSLVERWLARFGEQRTLALLEANNRPPRLTCALHDIEHRDEIVASLESSGLRVEPGALLKNTVAVTGGSVIPTDAFRRGAISIQDEASQAIPLLLGVQPGDRVLDLCAAPGGKTRPLVPAAGPTGIVIAADRHAHRLRAMRNQFERLHIASRLGSGGLPCGPSGISLVELDAERPLPFRAQFDKILVDAPCSGTGTLARHPEIRWRLKPEQLAEFHGLQVAILTSALEALAPGGCLLYSTCSLEPEENENVIAEALRATPSIPISPAAELPTRLARHLAPGVDPASLFDASGYFRTFPGVHPTDGFFAAILQKPTASAPPCP